MHSTMVDMMVEENLQELDLKQLKTALKSIRKADHKIIKMNKHMPMVAAGSLAFHPLKSYGSSQKLPHLDNYTCRVLALLSLCLSFTTATIRQMKF